MKSQLLVFTCIIATIVGGCNLHSKGGDGPQALLGHVCRKPDGKHYGVADVDRCQPQDTVVSARPSSGLFGLQAKSSINYDTAKKQANSKTLAELANRRAEQERLRKIREAERTAAETRKLKPAVDAYINARTKENQTHEGALWTAAEVLRSQFGGNTNDSWQLARDFIAPKLAEYDTPEWEEKFKGERSYRDTVLETLTEARKQATRRIVADTSVHWESESDPVRIKVVAELKKAFRARVDKLGKTLSPEEARYIIDELDKQIEANL
jgi:hypothetical protein